jgi:hypothetical protein
VPPSAAKPSESPRGAYGLRIEGLDGASRLLVPVPEAWPRLRLEHEPTDPGPVRDGISNDSARMTLAGGGMIEVERPRGLATIRTSRRLDAAALVHPYLAPIAAVLAYWHRHESFHGAAIVVDGGAWGLLGGRHDGKSSLAAWMALHGGDVLCDDMIVVDGSNAFTGPRSLDLRGEAAEHLGAGEPLGVVGARERWRLELPQRGASVPLRGWVFLAWADRVELGELPPAGRLSGLSAHRGIRVPPNNPVLLLELAALPAWRFARPRAWEQLGSSCDLLLEALSR